MAGKLPSREELAFGRVMACSCASCTGWDPKPPEQCICRVGIKQSQSLLDKLKGNDPPAFVELIQASYCKTCYQEARSLIGSACSRKDGALVAQEFLEAKYPELIEYDDRLRKLSATYRPVFGSKDEPAQSSS